MISRNNVFLILETSEQRDKIVDGYKDHEYFTFENFDGKLHNSIIIDGKQIIRTEPKEGINGIGAQTGLLIQRANTQRNDYLLNELLYYTEQVETNLYYWLSCIRNILLLFDVPYLGIIKTGYGEENISKAKLHGPNYISLNDLLFESTSTITMVPKASENYKMLLGMPPNFRNVLYSLPFDILLCITASEEEIVKNSNWE